MAKLTKQQSAALEIIANGGAHRVRTNTLNALRDRGLVNKTSPIELTATGLAALAQISAAEAKGTIDGTEHSAKSAANHRQMIHRLHYTTSTNTSRLCGAPSSEWSTVEAGAVTCPACLAELKRLMKLHEPKPACARCGDSEPGWKVHGTPNALLCEDCYGQGPVGCAAPVRAAWPNLSWKPEVIADGSGQWCGNELRFATKQEAEANVRDLSWRWMLVRETRAVESTDPVNYTWAFPGLVEVKP